MSNFKGYYMKCNNCTFQDPSISREGFEFFPYLIQVKDSGTLASGKITFKVLPHIRRKINVSFPPMTPEQFRLYSNALKFKEKGAGMKLSIEAYDNDSDSYITDTYYHNDIGYKPIIYNNQVMIKVNDFSLIGH